jgi:hypothetical protein
LHSQLCEEPAGRAGFQFATMESALRGKTLSKKWPALYRDRPRDSQLKNRGGIPEK